MDIILVITTKAMYFFEEYKKTCTKCPVETACWTPKLLEEPIPLENVKLIIEPNMNQLFGLEVEQTVREYFLFKNVKMQHKLFYMKNYQSKEKILSILRESNEKLDKSNDPIAEHFIKARSLTLTHTQVVGMKSFGEKEVRSPVLMCVDQNAIALYHISLADWEWIPELEQDQKNTLLSAQEREKLKALHEVKEVIPHFNNIERKRQEDKDVLEEDVWEQDSRNGTVVDIESGGGGCERHGAADCADQCPFHLHLLLLLLRSPNLSMRAVTIGKILNGFLMA
eukprot:TRINITY_DN4742_c0_g1_i4.p1 TRINITY_DN4742_c0_g1~~TRINITY_DN4742_c0_g1_i4.p1  ORF type:complete len:282 (+),score=75.86 TRINITY_DN4742_c0_g1_i4:492-1337(+)